MKTFILTASALLLALVGSAAATPTPDTSGYSEGSKEVTIAYYQPLDHPYRYQCSITLVNKNSGQKNPALDVLRAFESDRFQFVDVLNPFDKPTLTIQEKQVSEGQFFSAPAMVENFAYKAVGDFFNRAAHPFITPQTVKCDHS